MAASGILDETNEAQRPSLRTGLDFGVLNALTRNFSAALTSSDVKGFGPQASTRQARWCGVLPSQSTSTKILDKRYLVQPATSVASTAVKLPIMSQTEMETIAAEALKDLAKLHGRQLLSLLSSLFQTDHDFATGGISSCHPLKLDLSWVAVVFDGQIHVGIGEWTTPRATLRMSF
jgi:hypothetical protein